MVRSPDRCQLADGSGPACGIGERSFKLRELIEICKDGQQLLQGRTGNELRTLDFLLDRGRPLPLDEVRRAPWYTSLYLKLNDKTRQRDLHRLRELELACLDTDNALWSGLVVPGNIKPLGKPESR